jgi:hypothetical protein
LPGFVEKMFLTDLKGWQLSAPGDMQDSSFRMYQKDSSQLHYLLTDYNGDSIPDFAGILKDSTGRFALFKIYSINEYYSYDQLENYGKLSRLNIGLRFIQPNTPFHIDGDHYETFKWGAIERHNLLNKGRKIFYANEKGFYVIDLGG